MTQEFYLNKNILFIELLHSCGWFLILVFISIKNIIFKQGIIMI